MLSVDGVFVYGVRDANSIGGVAGVAGWVRVAKPRAPLVRGLAIARPTTDDEAAAAAAAAERADRAALRDEAILAWSDSDGIRSATVVRARRHRLLGATTKVEQPCLLIGSGEGSGPRFPLACLDPRDGTLDVLWSPDSRAVTHSAHRPSLPPTGPDPLASPGGGPDPARTQVLDVIADGPRTAWLACLTDTAEFFVAGWDLIFGQFGRWSRLPDPFRTPSSAHAATACALVRIASAPALIAADQTGRLAVADLRSATRGRCVWRAVALPTGLQPAPIRALAAADRGGQAWLAAATSEGLWLARLSGSHSAPVCGPATLVPVEPVQAPATENRNQRSRQT